MLIKADNYCLAFITASNTYKDRWHLFFDVFFPKLLFTKNISALLFWTSPRSTISNRGLKFLGLSEVYNKGLNFSFPLLNFLIWKNQLSSSVRNLKNKWKKKHVANLTCFKEESFMAKSPWLLAAVRRKSAWSLDAAAICEFCETFTVRVLIKLVILIDFAHKMISLRTKWEWLE